jgi:uncharacterized protein YjbJ (UPF0337 family)
VASSDALPIPRKNVAYRVVFPILDADGDLVTGAAGLDSEVSKDQGTFADCTNEATEIATSSGMYYLDLTSTEMNADCVAVIVKTSTSGAKTTPMVFYPLEDGDWRVNVVQFGSTAGTFASGIPDVNTVKVSGTAQTARDLGASVLLSAGTGTGQLDFTSGVVKANATQWLGGTIPAVNVTGVPLVDLKYTLGTISPATAGSVRADAVTGAVGSVTGAVGSVTGAVGSVTGAVGSVTGNVGGNVTGSVGSVVGAVGSVTGNVGGNVTGSIGSLATQAKADVNAEVVDTLATDTYAEPSSVPSATASIKDKLGWVALVSRNRVTQTSTTQKVRNSGDSADVGSSTLSDDGTTMVRGAYS